jgi:hypothetical protein
VRLRDAPYGRYPALADLVNLDCARASIPLARRALQSGNKAAARQLIDRSLIEVKTARDKEEYWRQINAAGPGGGDFADAQDLANLKRNSTHLRNS